MPQFSELIEFLIMSNLLIIDEEDTCSKCFYTTEQIWFLFIIDEISRYYTTNGNGEFAILPKPKFTAWQYVYLFDWDENIDWEIGLYSKGNIWGVV
tara:strand:+ start:202 stop:489 length:288 start_codon:yes stop_codon:yes gene_type:complete